MEYDKPWLSIEDQIELLVSGKGLECRDIDKLREALSRIGYYRLSAYWFPFKVIDNNGYKVFRRGTTFERILMTYEFDRRLRLLMFEAVSRIEIFLRCRIAHLASEEVGAFGYPEAAKSRLKREYSSAKKSEQYIKHFASKYGDMHDLPPYWMMVECATMGTIELLFSKVSPKVRVAIASEFGVRVPVLKNWLSVLRVSRNACCHHSRVWNRIWGVRPIIPKDWVNFDASNGRTFSVLSVLYYLLCAIGDCDSWRKELDGLLGDFDEIELDKVGFPENWDAMQPWGDSCETKGF